MIKILTSVLVIMGFMIGSVIFYNVATYNMNAVEFHILDNDATIDNGGMISGYILKDNGITTEEINLYIPVYLLDKGDKIMFDTRLLNDPGADIWIEGVTTYLSSTTNGK
jgi:hypothetical protein